MPLEPTMEIGSPPSPPFIEVDGLPNFRDCGGYPVAQKADTIVRRGVLYRSADPSRISERGIAQLRALDITKVFDLRSHGEISESTKNGWGQIREWDSALRIPASVFTDSDLASGQRAKRDAYLREEGHQGFVNYYRDVLASATSHENEFEPLRQILRYFSETPATQLRPILIHCSLGKDRTGVICALILSLCGVDDSIVAHEYAITVLGLREKVAAIIAEIHPDGTGMTEVETRFFGSKKESMQCFLEQLRQNGGVEQYIEDSGILTDYQVKQLQQNLTVRLLEGEEPLDWRRHAEMLEQFLNTAPSS
ncbi:uncharacterized protein GLRG_05584 [Colletotrichum graminicola M1.001]|uniref:Tyrosine specific protein phosphatases domain-containing protein n=1 Tax=Colletotrichum graminicola (strain M1.001 / M2 / FGSC 10212) TaxID=645133 RepID=E3QHV2_COLGM|nr:uncharacterized protein GLRG_05584 [Colletotrichum graminicola M1.001]EFQ30440.1 hypothetical protein GLRG_05584 [Colletotrichum graminicola M1.001]